MLKSYEKFLYPPGLHETPPKTFHTLLQWLLFLRVLILTILLGTSVILQSKSHELTIPPLGYVAYFIAGVYLFTIISALVLRLIKNYKQFALFQNVSDVLLAGCIVYATGGSQSIFTILFFLPILSGSFILLRFGGISMAAISTITYGFILMVELLYDHLLFPDLQSPLTNVIVAMHFFAIHGLVFFIVATLSIIIFERLRKTESDLFESTLNYDRLSILYKQIFEDITTGIVTVDDRGSVTSINKAAEKISGYSSGEIMWRKIEDVFPGFKQNSGSNTRQLTELIKPDGSKIPVGYSWTRLNMPGECEDCRVYTMQDLSQIRDMEKQVKQAEKMATIGEMAAGIAHEFRNPLAAISGAAQMLVQDGNDGSDQRRLVEIVTRESDRMEGIINEFLSFSKPPSPDKQWFSLRELIDKTILNLQQSSRWPTDSCRTIANIADDIDAWGDSDQIQQVLINLISNSCQALGKNGGEIKVTGEEQKDAGKECVVIRVTDNGPGIEPDVSTKIFEPFFTTRQNGTGLGLAIVKQLIESHNGEITVESIPSDKTVFMITLPLPSH